MGTRAAGLIRWRNGKMDRIGAGHGLPEREVRGMIEDEQGYFWMPSNRGILRANRKQLHAWPTVACCGWTFRYWINMTAMPSPECSTSSAQLRARHRGQAVVCHPERSGGD